MVALSVGEMAGMMELLMAEKKAEAMVETRAVLWEILLAGGKDVDLAGGSVATMVVLKVGSLVSGKVASMVDATAAMMADMKALLRAVPMVEMLDSTRVVMTACSAVVAKGDLTEDATDDETAEATAERTA